MPARQDGGVALVTGGARGIGEAAAERLAEDGAAIAIADLDGVGAGRRRRASPPATASTRSDSR